MKKVVKKVFTKNKANDIIKKDYNPFEVNYKLIYKRRSGLYKMKRIKNLLKKEEIKKFNFKDRIGVLIFNRTFIKVYKMGIEKGFNSRM